MKTRISALLLALILLVSALTVPVSAATAKDVHNYLKNFAMAGKYDEDANWYHSDLTIDSGSSIYYGVYYLVDTGYIECSIYTTSFEVTWRISSNPSPAYNAFILMYDDSDSKGSVSIAANYNGAAYSAFKSFSGDSSIKSDMLEILNGLLPAVVELTRLIINEEDYTLKDLGLTSYKKCDFFHAYDHGKVIQQPTCVTAGTTTYTCRVCGTVYNTSIAATGVHTWDKGTVVTAPTCTTAGVRRYTCSVCKTTKDETIPALGHTWVYVKPLTESDSLHASTGLYNCVTCGATKETRLCAEEVFTDMPAEGNWAHDPIDWAYFNNITSGVTKTTFVPNMTITRAQAVTFLWAAAGKPEPANPANPFTDVPDDGWFTKAVLWAVENGITKGLTADTFGPNGTCTRAQIVTFLWAAAGKPEPEAANNPFTDVPESSWYTKAVLWAVENGITKGVTADTFGPDNSCTRAQVVTFLYKANR